MIWPLFNLNKKEEHREEHRELLESASYIPYSCNSDPQ